MLKFDISGVIKLFFISTKKESRLNLPAGTSKFCRVDLTGVGLSPASRVSKSLWTFLAMSPIAAESTRPKMAKRAKKVWVYKVVIMVLKVWRKVAQVINQLGNYVLQLLILLYLFDADKKMIA